MGLPTEDERAKAKDNFICRGKKEDSQTDKNEESTRGAKTQKVKH